MRSVAASVKSSASSPDSIQPDRFAPRRSRAWLKVEPARMLLDFLPKGLLVHIHLIWLCQLVNTKFYYIYGSVSQGLGTTKSTNLIGWNGNWPRSRFSHLDRQLDRKCFEVKKLQTKMQNHWLFSSNNIYFCKWQKADEKKKVEKTSKIWKNEIRLVAVRKRNVSWYKPVTLNELSCSYFCHIINILLTELSGSVWENLDLGRVYRPHCVRSVLTTSVKILPYRPPARLIRAK